MEYVQSHQGSMRTRPLVADYLPALRAIAKAEDVRKATNCKRRSWLAFFIIQTHVFTCVSYAEARNSYRLDVCPSVCLSVTRWYCIKTAVMLSSPHDSPFILVLCISRSSRNSDGVTPCGGAKYRWGIKFARFSTNKLLYLANDTRYRHGCYGRRIGNHTQAFEWHQYQWPSETSKPVFKVTILFNVK